MLLKSIHIINFRQFVDEMVEFSTDANKNVTVIMGDGGTGKSTFAKAIIWCLYGTPGFEDPILANKIVASKTGIGEDLVVKVELKLIHANIEFTIITEQSYKKESPRKLRPGYVKRSIFKKIDGQQEKVKEVENDAQINLILPRELSGYFFFDGERIERLSKEIQSGRSQTFSDAVAGLLGLDAFVSAMRHLKPTVKDSVVGVLNASYDSRSNTKIAEYTEKITQYNEQITELTKRSDEISNEIDLAETRIDTLKERLRFNEESEKIQLSRDRLEREVEAAKASKSRKIKKMFEDISTNMKHQGYFATPLILEALQILSDADLTRKDIPNMNAKTIDFLLKQGECICGTKLEPGNKAYEHLLKLFAYVPPKSIGIQVGDFVNQSKAFTRASAYLYENFVQEYESVRELEEEIIEKESDIKSISDKLANYKGVGHIQKELTDCQNAVKFLRNEQAIKQYQSNELITKRDRMASERSELSLLDAKNRTIETHIAYAEYMYNQLNETYSKKETEVRNNLEKAINQIFESIFGGDFYLSLDEKYNVRVNARTEIEFGDNIETSTSQSISVIFAFIAGIIKLARESEVDAGNLISSEAYPLVMDAPLSSFDKKRIKTVCTTLPQIAEQVIVFIKDTDGELAEKHMGNKIGISKEFVKKNQFQTDII